MDETCILWPAPPTDSPLDFERVHIWAAPLQVSAIELNHLQGTLAPDEMRRAESFRFDRDRNRFIAARGTLRTILGRYLGAPPSRIPLEYGPHGKPSLAGAFVCRGLHFNLAHSEDLALLAVARGRVVGVDLERVRALNGTMEMAACMCSGRENAELRSLAAGERQAAFFRVWTLKEAWLKATGVGIGQSLNKVEVCFGRSQTARFVGLPEDTAIPAAQWNLRELVPMDGFVGAIVFPGNAVELSCWRWEPEGRFEIAKSGFAETQGTDMAQRKPMLLAL